MRLRDAVLALIGVLPVLAGLPATADGATFDLTVIGAIPGPDGGWDLVSIDAAARRLYLAHGDAVMEVDLDAKAVTASVVAGNRLHAVVPLPGGEALATNGGNNTATLFETATGKVLASIPTGAGPDAAIFDSASGLVLVMDGKAGDITLIDPVSATSVGQIPVGGKLELPAVDGKGHAYINIEDKDEIAVVDIAARKVTAHYKLPDCEEPSGLALDPRSGTLVTSCANKKAIALKAADGRVLATLPIGGGPDTVIFDPNRKLFFIPCGEGALVAISDTDKPAVVATIPTQMGARTGALDEKTGRIYLPTADFGPQQPGEKRRPLVPGTFQLLIVGEK